MHSEKSVFILCWKHYILAITRSRQYILTFFDTQHTRVYANCKSERPVLALKMGPFWWVKRFPTFESNLAWAGIAFRLSSFGLICSNGSRTESDFGLQSWIGTLGLKQIFLIFSAMFLYMYVGASFSPSQCVKLITNYGLFARTTLEVWRSHKLYACKNMTLHELI